MQEFELLHKYKAFLTGFTTGNIVGVKRCSLLTSGGDWGFSHNDDDLMMTKDDECGGKKAKHYT